MFDITSSKLLLLGIVALLVIGPKDFPRCCARSASTSASFAATPRSSAPSSTRPCASAELTQLKKDVENIAQETEASLQRHRADGARRAWTTRASRVDTSLDTVPKQPPIPSRTTPTACRSRRRAGAGRIEAGGLNGSQGSEQHPRHAASPGETAAPARRPPSPAVRSRRAGREGAAAMQDKPDTPRPAQRPEGHDEVEASKAPLIEHLIELRQRLIYALIGVGVGFVVCFYFATRIYNLLVWPYQVARGGQKIEMIFTAPHEFFFTKLKLALFGAVFLAFPIIAMQVYKFVAPGLYKNERAAFRPYLLATFLLFIAGALVVYFVVMPLAMIFFLSMEQTGGQVEIQLQARVSEYLSLIMTLILGFGIMFQLPVVLTLLAHAGIVGAQQLRQTSAAMPSSPSPAWRPCCRRPTPSA